MRFFDMDHYQIIGNHMETESWAEGIRTNFIGNEIR